METVFKAEHPTAGRKAVVKMDLQYADYVVMLYIDNVHMFAADIIVNDLMAAKTVARLFAYGQSEAIASH